MSKVLFAITTLFGGGAERVATVWANKLVNRGYDVTFLIYGRSENEYFVDDRIHIKTVASDYKAYKKMGYFARLKAMRKIIKEVKPEITVNFLPRMQIWMMMAAWGLKIKRVETVRVSPWMICSGSKAERALWKHCFTRADKVIFQTAEQGEFFNDKVRAKSVVISNPISEQYCNNPKTSYSSSNNRFVAAGRITSQKNYPVMIEAFSKALKTNPELTLSIYGTGDEAYIAEMQALISEAGIEDSVKLMGRTTDMLSVLQNADAFLMTSDFEGMPNALAEAMVMGLPCISTNCRTGPKDMIDNGESGFLVNVGDSDDIADAILKVARMNAEESKEMGAKARAKMLDMCGEENSLKKLIDLIENC